jgi:hypothetical protein
MFEGVPKRSQDMTRDELLHVIAYLLADKEWWRKEAYDSLRLARRSSSSSEGPTK